MPNREFLSCKSVLDHFLQGVSAVQKCESCYLILFCNKDSSQRKEIKSAKYFRSRSTDLRRPDLDYSILKSDLPELWLDNVGDGGEGEEHDGHEEGHGVEVQGQGLARLHLFHRGTGPAVCFARFKALSFLQGLFAGLQF